MTEQNPFAPAPAVPEQHPAAPAPSVSKGRRALFAGLRWTAAVLVFAAVGSGVAYGLVRSERTDLPGLGTEDDGRWVYPALTKPTLAPGAPQPFAPDNKDGIHYAALYQLLLPAPAGSTPDPGLKQEKDQAVSADTFLEEYEPTVRPKMKQAFTDDGLRQIVARGWTMPDGTRTRVYLLRFHSSGFVDAFEGCGINMNINGVNRIEGDSTWSKARNAQSSPDLRDVSLFTEAEPAGDEQVAAGCVRGGDLQAVVLQTRKGHVASVPFHQTVILQDQLLH
ncbi:hypothetical protein Slala03_15010 [Streptomyces lavendulae subsp. lavendulae]|uniref:hypothetical protein n=1 Tax=Streptomyces lavendulae TaxID=1914 RepID=UPI00249F982F|nr:hypothetical protein [Streptomyces lavendulae]GLV81812.1 hypothetical protein Slala03_15010 [Streptomyces lavendulae subsp. lavendulae]